MASPRIAEVVLDCPTGRWTSAIFSYRVPAWLDPHIQPGQFVWVPLRNRQVQGVVLSISESPALLSADPQELQDIADLVDPEAVIPPDGLRLAAWIAQTTLTPLSRVLHHFLPPGLLQKPVVTWRITPHGKAVDPAILPIAERGLLYHLQRHGERSEPDLLRELRISKSRLRNICLRLCEQQFIVSDYDRRHPIVRPRMVQGVSLSMPPDAPESISKQVELTPTQQIVVRWLAERGASAPSPISLAEIATATGISKTVVSTAIRALQNRHILEIVRYEVLRSPLLGSTDEGSKQGGHGQQEMTIPALTPAQQRVWEVLSVALQRLHPEQAQATDSQHQVFLLHGVTGSGKTEIYLRAAEQVLQYGRSVVVLVPEIALTVQLVRRFSARFPGQLAILHSRLSQGERYDEWRRIRHGQAKVVVGSRSALFAPVEAIGLIIVDEEHESSYKQNNAPAYHTRTAAVQLGKISGAVVVLGSATPSMESYDAARRGQWTLLELPERIGPRIGRDGLLHAQPLPLPQVVIVDMRRELRDGNRSIFSDRLQQALALALERGEQAMLFLNRRGAAQLVLCRDCGGVLRCPKCQSALVMHYHDPPSPDPSAGRQSVLLCHTCSHSQLVPAFCPQCLSPRIRSFGIGTQRVEEEVQRLFPHARTMRWDSDSATGKDAHRRLFDAFLDHQADVLIGTQMIARGLDFPKVSVVGVVEADTMISFPDFRSGERTFQLLTQVAGRAGRRNTRGLVIIQTYTPDHYAIRAAQHHDYHGFAIQELSFRRQTGYPPFGQLIRMVTMHRDRERCRQLAIDMATRLQASIRRLGLVGWGIIGPAPAYLQRVRGQWRWHVVIRTPPPADGDRPLPASLARLFADLGPSIEGWDIDVEPMDML